MSGYWLLADVLAKDFWRWRKDQATDVFSRDRFDSYENANFMEGNPFTANTYSGKRKKQSNVL